MGARHAVLQQHRRIVDQTGWLGRGRGLQSASCAGPKFFLDVPAGGAILRQRAWPLRREHVPTKTGQRFRDRCAVRATA